MVERTDDDGRWVEDGPGVWTLVEPSQAWIDAHPPIDVVEPPDPAEAIREALAPITSTSTSAQVRTALLGLKAALET